MPYERPLTAESATELIRGLSPESFPTVCARYLYDAGYRITVGPPEGQDGGVDIYGLSPNGNNFVAHCTTTQQKSFRAKLYSDVIGGVRRSLKRSTVTQEILFLYSRNLPKVGPHERVALKDTLVAEIVSIDPRYIDNPPNLSIRTGPELGAEISQCRRAAYDYLARFLRPRDPAIDLDQDDFGRLTLNREAFKPLILNYSYLLPRGYKVDILKELTRCVWGVLVYDPIFASEIFHLDKVDVEISPLIQCLCRVSLGQTHTVDEYLDTWRVISALSSSFFEAASDLNLICTLLLRRMLYEHPEHLDDTRVLDLCKEIALLCDPFWDRFILDTFLRSTCDVILLSPDSHTTLTQFVHRIVTNSPRELLCRLIPFLATPLIIARKHSRSEVFSLLSNMARECRTAVDARWVLQAFHRIISLFEISDDSEMIEQDDLELLKHFPAHLRQETSTLQFRYFHALLAMYARTKECNYLHQFEREFPLFRPKLLLPQISHLQLEYLASLDLALQCEDPGLENLQFNLMFRAQRDPSTHPLLANPLLSHRTMDRSFLLDDRKSKFKWIECYALSLYRCYASTHLAMNCMFALQLRLTTKISTIREHLSNAVVAAVGRLSSVAHLQRPSVCAKVAATFSFISRSTSIPIMLPILEQALKAEEYDLLRNAREIGHALYFCAYYGESLDVRARGRYLMIRLGEETRVGTGSAKIHWAYFACVMFSELPQERIFLRTLFESTNSNYSHVDLLGKPEQLSSAAFSSAALKAVEAFQGRSLLAATLCANLISAEIWNTLGTTIMLHRNSDSDIEATAMATLFYACARCFVRERKEIDLKYAYNFIKASCLEISARNDSIKAAAAIDICRYITSHVASRFAHKTECCEPYFSLLDQSWDSFPAELQSELLKRLLMRPWIKESIGNDRMNITLKV